MSEDIQKFPADGNQQLAIIQRLIDGQLLPEARAQLIDAYFNKSLDDEASDAFEKHYFSSDEFFKEVQIREALISALHQDRDEKSIAAAVFSRRQPGRGYAWVFAAAAILVIMLMIKIWFASAPETDGEFSVLDSTTTQSYADLFGDAFSTSAVFEAQLTENVRSDSHDVAVLRPRSGSIAANRLSFSWQWDNQAQPQSLSLHIYDNFEWPKLDTVVTGSQLDLDRDLPPGLYYWSLESENEVLHLGKFFILPEQNP